MLDYIKKEDRYEAKQGEEYVVVPKSALNTLLEAYYDVAEGLMRDENFMSQDTIDKAIEALDTGLIMQSYDVDSIQTMFNYFALVDIYMEVAYALQGVKNEKEIEEITELIGEKIYHPKHRISSAEELRDEFHVHIQDYK